MSTTHCKECGKALGQPHFDRCPKRHPKAKLNVVTAMDVGEGRVAGNQQTLSGSGGR